MSSTFALSEHFEVFVRDLVASGRFRDADEVVQAGLRLLEDREADLRARRAELEASFEEALADVEAGSSLTVEQVRSNLDRWHDDAKRARAAAE